MITAREKNSFNNGRGVQVSHGAPVIYGAPSGGSEEPFAGAPKMNGGRDASYK